METFSLSEDSARKHLQERLDFVLQVGQQMAYEQDRELRYTWVANAMYGASDEAVLGCRDAEILSDASEASALEAAKYRVMRTGVGMKRRFPITTDGTTRYYAITIVPMHSAEGNVAGVRGAVIDRTEAHERETALNEARNQAQTAQAEAEDARRVMSMVLGNASHALLTPLSGMLSLIDALRARNVDAVQEPLERIRKSGERLQRAIERLLDLSALEAGEAHLQPERLDVRTTVDEAVQMLRGRAEDKGLAFTMDVPEAPVSATLDPSALERVVRNLVSNAIKYTDEGTVRIALRTERSGAVVRIVVEDTGKGIPEDFLPALFEPFARVGTSNVSGGGTGLGAAITKRFVDAMGGTIDVDTALGEGTTFTVHLPATPSDAV